MTVSPFGVYLRERRTSAGKSLRETAEALSISHVYLGEVERGRRRMLPEKHWQPLASFLPNVTVEELRVVAASSEPIDPAMVEGQSRAVVVALARALDENGLSDDIATEILRLLERRQGATHE